MCPVKFFIAAHRYVSANLHIRGGQLGNGKSVSRSNWGIFSDGQLDRFLAIFTNRSAFDHIKSAKMVHADLWEGNVLVRENEGKWEIAALINIDKAIFGDKNLEFAFPTVLNDDFLQGYGSRPDESPGSKYRGNAYRLLESFMYAYIWYAQFADQERLRRPNARGCPH